MNTPSSIDSKRTQERRPSPWLRPQPPKTEQRRQQLDRDRVGLSQELQNERGCDCQLRQKLDQIQNELRELQNAPKPQARKAAQGPGKGGGSKGPSVSNPNADAGFLWKPVSDSDGNLAILLPPKLTGKVQSVEVLSPDGQQLGTGRNGGVGNGQREHFRFSKPGGSFPAGSIVKITLKDGSVQQVPIENPGVRNEGGKK